MKGHDQSVTSVAWSPQGERLVSTGADGRARVWDVSGDYMLLSLPYEFIDEAAWSPDGKNFVVTTDPGPEKKYKGMVAAWDMEKRKPIFETTGTKDDSWYWIWPAYTPDGKNFIARTEYLFPDTTDANKYYLFDSQSGEIVREYKADKETLLLGAGISPDGRLVGAGDFEGNIYFWEMSSGELVKKLKCLSWGHLVEWSPDGSKIALLCFDFDKSLVIIQVLDAVTYKPLVTIEGDYALEGFGWIEWAPDSNRIAVGGGNDETGTISNPVFVFDASTGEEVLRIVKHTGGVDGH